jgi:hypothetical protein
MESLHSYTNWRSQDPNKDAAHYSKHNNNEHMHGTAANILSAPRVLHGSLYWLIQVPYSINTSNTTALHVHPHSHLRVCRRPFCLKAYRPSIWHHTTSKSWSGTCSLYYFNGCSRHCWSEEKETGQQKPIGAHKPILAFLPIRHFWNCWHVHHCGITGVLLQGSSIRNEITIYIIHLFVRVFRLLLEQYIRRPHKLNHQEDCSKQPRVAAWG